MLRFLVADDSAPTRQWLRQLIQAHPARRVMAEATDGLEAAKQAADYHPHVAVIDVIMPGLDGIRAAQRIKALAPATRVIVYSAHHNSAFRRRALAAGADAYIEKTDLTPVRLGELISRLFDEEPPASSP